MVPSSPPEAKPAARRRPRALLLHGLTGGPSELAPLAAGLAVAGWECALPRWRGHATTPADLASTTAEALVDQARELGRSDPDAIVGLSMGALLGLVAAAEAPRPVPLVLLAPAVRMAGASAWFDRLGRLPWLPARMLSKSTDWGGEGRAGARGPVGEAALRVESAGSDRYDRVPLAWARRLRWLRGEALAVAGQVRGPVLVVHGMDDDVAGAESSLRLLERLPAGARCTWLAGAGHQLGAGAPRAVVAELVARFLGDARVGEPP